MAEISRQASEAWGGGEAIPAYDLMTIDVPAHTANEGIPGAI